MCDYCKLIQETLDLGYKTEQKKIVSQIMYVDFYWTKDVKIPLDFCPACGKKLNNGKEERSDDE